MGWGAFNNGFRYRIRRRASGCQASSRPRHSIPRKQPHNKPLSLFDQVGVGLIVFAHALNDLAGYAHPHVLQVAVVPHHIFQQLFS